ncbi:GFA family protein [Pelagibacterium halotolerans]|uniref:GFA family protein n=1 Tax=Pelagibacterium halotolerans TaxID=531813 RepID=UPI00384BB200
MTRTGGCACGAIRFEVTEPFIGIGSCHCTDCQKASGGGPNYVALTPRNALDVVAGEVKLFHRKGDSGAVVARAFCGECGTPLWSIPAHEPFIPIKLGALDDTADLMPQMQIYVDSAPSWHAIDESLPAFPKMPPQAP